METSYFINIKVQSDKIEDFIDWQRKFNAAIAKFPGFISLEISSSTQQAQPVWSIVQRFSDEEHFVKWRDSKVRKELIDELPQFSTNFQELEMDASGVTEVFVTQVNPEQETAFKEWLGKIQQEEARFPGFRGMYIQAPKPGEGRNWLTFLKFDTPEHLDHWLSSEKRQKILVELKPLITSLESHRVISPFGGWFASIQKESGALPPVWKQSMIVLLVLFPIVMLELKFLPYLTGGLNPSLSTFIGNALSVALIGWPFMPIAIIFLAWWLVPKGKNIMRINLIGVALLLGLYLLEIILFWKLLS